MINKVTQTRCSSMYFFPTNAVYSLKSFISATSNVNFYLFLPLLGFGEEDPRGASGSTKMLALFFASLVHPRNTRTDL